MAFPAALQQFTARIDDTADHALTGTDPAGTVLVCIDGAGRLRDVRLAPHWRRVPPGESVPAAANDAVRQRVAAWQAVVAPVVPLPDNGEEWALLTARGLTDLRVARELNRLVAAAVERLRTANASFADHGTVVAHSRDRRVSVTAVGGWISALEVDARWLRDAATGTVEAHLREALGAALTVPDLRDVVVGQRQLVRELGTAN